MKGRYHRLEIPPEFNHHHNHQIPHPITGHEHWGKVKVTSKHLTQPGGPIILRAGKHIGPHKGFGIRHIWAERGQELQTWGYPSIYTVPNFINEIIQDKAKIVCEFNAMRVNERLIVMKGRKGCVVLEAREEIPKNNEEPELLYSIVTAYRGRNPSGQLVATIDI